MDFINNLKEVDINLIKIRTLVLINVYEYLIGTLLGYCFNYFVILEIGRASCRERV